MAGYNPGRGGIGEARCYALRDAIRTEWPNLTTVLGRDSLSNFLLTSDMGGELTTEMVQVGDLGEVWDLSTDGGCLRCFVVPGDYNRNLDFTARRRFAHQPGITNGLQQCFFTTVLIYFHPQAFRIDDPSGDPETNTVVVERVMDWLRAGVLNNGKYRTFLLTSTEYTSGEWVEPSGWDRDKLTKCRAVEGYSGRFRRGFNTIVCSGLYMVHRGEIAG